ncbi:MAG: hypothetical protein HN731_01845 [Rhodospirillaceae bacterium]|jgi:hypothetical protein|nr:hypothetical protein [Rhodospirillaceae bacterium]MBT5939655.1 hypothetical protein [Rhodospirillaceae bacterium]MBT7953905.1 hypothetical protein [Rhodospirillaceae bacterium]
MKSNYIDAKFWNYAPNMRYRGAWRMQIQIVLFITFVLSACAGQIDGLPNRPFGDDGLDTTKFAFKKEKHEEYFAASGAAKRQLRNEIVDAQLRAQDIKFQDFLESLVKFNVGLGIGTDWTVLALNGLGATTGGVTAKAAYSAASAGIIGAKGAIDKHVFMEKAMPVIISQMIAERTTVKAKIRKGLVADVSQYSLNQGLADVEEYRQAGSLITALVTITKNAGVQADKSEQEIKDVAKGSFQKDQATVKLQKFLNTGTSAQKTQNRAKLKSAMAKFGLSTAPGNENMLMFTDVLGEVRAKIVEELGL